MVALSGLPPRGLSSEVRVCAQESGIALCAHTAPAKLNTSLDCAMSYGYYTGYFPNQPIPDGPNALALRIVEVAAAIGRRA